MKPNVGRIATLYVLFIAFNQKRILFNKSKVIKLINLKQNGPLVRTLNTIQGVKAWRGRGGAGRRGSAACSRTWRSPPSWPETGSGQLHSCQLTWSEGGTRRQLVASSWMQPIRSCSPSSSSYSSFRHWAFLTLFFSSNVHMYIYMADFIYISSSVKILKRKLIVLKIYLDFVYEKVKFSGLG